MAMSTGMPRFKPMKRLPSFPGTPRPRNTDPQPARTDSQAPAQDTASNPPPPWFTGSPEEWIVYQWLAKQQLPFGYQPIGAPVVADQNNAADHPAFVVYDRSPGLVVEVQDSLGYATAAETQAITVRRNTLQAAGFTYVGVRATDVQQAPDETMQAALDGVQLFA